MADLRSKIAARLGETIVAQDKTLLALADGVLDIPEVANVAIGISDMGDLLAALSEVPKGWWWSVGTCSVSNDASIGPDVAHCDKETLRRFDDGLHADLERPATIADALRDCIRQAREAGVS